MRDLLPEELLAITDYLAGDSDDETTPALLAADDGFERDAFGGGPSPELEQHLSNT